MLASFGVYERRSLLGVGLSLLLAACGGPHCTGPTRAVTPPRDVPAPPLELAGVRLDATLEQVKRDCTALHGEYRDSGFCRPSQGMLSLANEGPWQLLGSRAILGGFGKVKRIEAVYLLGDSGANEQMGSLINRINAVLGGWREGDLGWCGERPDCDLSGYAAWSYAGGQVRLTSEKSAQSLQVSLTHEHDDMSERVIYGLPACER